MTMTITNLTVLPGLTLVGRRLAFGFVVSSDDIEDPALSEDVKVSCAGQVLFDNGKLVTDGVSFIRRPMVRASDRPDVNGVEFSIVTGEIFEEGQEYDLAIALRDVTTVVVPFSVAITSGPVIAAMTPVLGSDGASTTPTITIDIAPSVDDADVELSVVDFEVSASLSGSVLAIDDSTYSLKGMEGRRVDFGGSTVKILTVLDPTHATVSAGATPGAAVASFYTNGGLNVRVGGATVVDTGIGKTHGDWTGAIGAPAHIGWRRVVITPAGGAPALAIGDRVDITIDAVDSDGRRSSLNAFFYVGLRNGPTVTEVSPDPNTRGVGARPSVSFKIKDDYGIDLASLNVRYGQTNAIVNGVIQAAFTTASSITAITNGYTVVLQPNVGSTAAHLVGDMATIMVMATSTPGKKMNPVSWCLLPATASASGADAVGPYSSMTPTPNQAIVRTIPFDMRNESFGDPQRLKHNGYAFDGYWYNDGLRSSLRASWATEAASVNRSTVAEMPVVGFIVVTKTGWWIADAFHKMWMRADAVTLVPGWTMANGNDGGGDITDACWSNGMLFFTQNSCVFQVSFSDDLAWRMTAFGRFESMTHIADRYANASGGVVDPDWKLSSSTSQFDGLDAQSFGRGAWVLAACRDGDIEMSWECDLLMIARHAGRALNLNFNRRTVVIAGPGTPTTWCRPAFMRGEETKLVAAVDNKMMIIDWVMTLGALAGAVSTTTLPGATAKDLSLAKTRYSDRHLALVTQADRGVLLDLSLASAPVIVKQIQLTDVHASATEFTRGALDPSCEKDDGFMYFATKRGSGQVDVSRHFMLPASGVAGDRKLALAGPFASGTVISSLTVVMPTPHAAHRFLGTSWTLV
jgi:hypothetical protein